MRFKSLGSLKKSASREILLAELPQEIALTRYARDKAYKINELVREIHQRSYEWYGFTLAFRQQPDVIVDIGLPVNDQNQDQYVRLAPEKIAAYRDSLPENLVINGWLHSHGTLEYRHFSPTDEVNQAAVLDYVTSLIMMPVAQKEVVIRDLALMVMGEGETPATASVTLFTDVPVGRAQLFETVYGGFCFAIVIGDEGWTRQEIHYKKRGILTGETLISHREADLMEVHTGKIITPSAREALELEVKERLRPVAYTLEKLERG